MSTVCASCMDIMASIGIIATILTFVGIGAYAVNRVQSKQDRAQELVNVLAIAHVGDVVFMEPDGTFSDEARRTLIDDLTAANPGIKFVILSSGVRIARVEVNGA